ncbi:MAG: hypothetical protein ACRDX8_02880 [Acidimicrobiales bacterium]
MYASAERSLNWAAAALSGVWLATMVASAVWLRPPWYYWPAIIAIGAIYGLTMGLLTGKDLPRRIKEAPQVPWQSVASPGAHDLLPALGFVCAYALMATVFLLAWHQGIPAVAAISGGCALWMALFARRVRQLQRRGTVLLLLGRWADGPRWLVSERPQGGSPISG